MDNTKTLIESMCPCFAYWDCIYWQSAIRRLGKLHGMSQFTNSILIDLDFSVDKLLNTGNCCFLSSTYKKSSNIITYLTLSKFYIFDSQHISFMVGSDSMFLCCSYWTWDQWTWDQWQCITTGHEKCHQQNLTISD